MIRRFGPWLLLAAATLSGLWFLWQQRDIPAFGDLQDDSIYALSAMSLGEGNGYRISHLPTQPVQTKYPPLFPAILSLLWKWQPAFPSNLTLAAGLGAILYLVVLVLSYFSFQRFGFSSATCALLTSFVAVNAYMLHLSGSVMTELPYTAMLLGTLLLSESGLKRHWRWAVAAGLLAGLAYLTRSAALPLALGVPLVLFLRGNKTNAAAFVAGMAPAIIGWQIWVSAHLEKAQDWVMLYYTDYAGLERATLGWNNIGHILYNNSNTLLTGIGNLLFPLIGLSSLGHQCALVVSVAVIRGIIRLCGRSNQFQYPVYAALSCSLLLIWHYQPNERFTFPLLPLVVAGLWTECKNLWERVAVSWKRPELSNRVAAAGIGAMLAAFGVFFAWSLIDTRVAELPAYVHRFRVRAASLKASFEMVSRNTPREAVILSDQDSLLYLYTKRHSYRTVIPPPMMYPKNYSDIKAEFAKMPDAAARPWTYALLLQSDWEQYLESEHREWVRSAIRARTDLTIVYEDHFATLYRRNPPAGPALSARQR